MDMFIEVCNILMDVSGLVCEDDYLWSESFSIKKSAILDFQNQLFFAGNQCSVKANALLLYNFW